MIDIRNYSKKLLLFAALLFVPALSNAQSVGVGTNTPNANAILDVFVPNANANPQGMLFPRLTTVQRTGLGGAIGLPEEGMVVYDTDDSTIYHWTGTIWMQVGTGGADTDWTVGGGYVYNLTDSIGIGTAFPSTELDVNGTITTNDIEVNTSAVNNGTLDVLGLTTLANTDVVGTVNITGVTDIDGNFRAQDMITFDTLISGAAGIVVASGAGLVYKTDFTGNPADALLGDGTFGSAADADWQTGAGTVYNANDSVAIGTTTPLGPFHVSVDQDATPDSLFIVDTAANVGIGTIPTGTYKIEIAGNIGTVGINELSDKRWKKDITTLEGSLDKIMKLRGVNYNWKTEKYPEKGFESDLQIGFIAQEVEKVLPELVDTDVKGYKALEYSKLVAVLTEAIKEQQKIIDTQKGKIESLNIRVQKLESLEVQIQQITNQLGLDLDTSTK